MAAGLRRAAPEALVKTLIPDDTVYSRRLSEYFEGTTILELGKYSVDSLVDVAAPKDKLIMRACADELFLAYLKVPEPFTGSLVSPPTRREMSTWKVLNGKEVAKLCLSGGTWARLRSDLDAAHATGRLEVLDLSDCKIATADFVTLVNTALMPFLGRRQTGKPLDIDLSFNRISASVAIGRPLRESTENALRSLLQHTCIGYVNISSNPLASISSVYAFDSLAANLYAKFIWLPEEWVEGEPRGWEIYHVRFAPAPRERRHHCLCDRHTPQLLQPAPAGRHPRRRA